MFQGRFVWYELMTTDVEAATRFYGAVAGWTTQAWGKTGYTMWQVGDKGIGGVNPLSDDAKRMGAPPHWIANITCEDVDATVAKATALGATVLMPPTSMPTVGRFAVLADPQGATFAAFCPESAMDGGGSPAVGQFSWHEYYGSDHVAALGFYSALFGWNQTSSMDMGEMGLCQMYGIGEKVLGGMMNKPPMMPMAAWNFYVRVDDLEAALARVSANGGRLVMGPMEPPGGDRVATCIDPQGAMFSLHQLAADRGR